MGNFEESNFNEALKFYSSVNTHPIHVEIKNEEEIQSLFDYISYEKSGCFIRVLYNYIGREKFRKVLRSILHVLQE